MTKIREARHATKMLALLMMMMMMMTTTAVQASIVPMAVTSASVKQGGTLKVLVTGAQTAGGGGGLTVRLVDSAAAKGAPPLASVNAGSASDFTVVTLSVPSTATATGKYALELTKTAGGEKLSSTSVKVVGGASDVATSSGAFVVETDKPVYKPGQTVKIRVLHLTPSLMPKAGKVTVTVKDPRSFVMGRWRDVEVGADGVATVQFPTSADGALGTWTTEAADATTTTTPPSTSAAATFTIDRYVLPTFEVTVTPDSEAVYQGQTSITGSVTARYTYGEPLADASTFTINVWQRSSGYGGFGGGGGGGGGGDIIAVDRPAVGGGTSPTQTQQQEYTLVASLRERAFTSRGSSRFAVDVSEAKINFGYGWGQAPELVLEAMVTDGATGATQNGTASLMPAYNLYKLELDGPPSAKPGLGVALTLRASRYDGSLLAATFTLTKNVRRKNDNGRSVTTSFDVTTSVSAAGDVAEASFTVDVPADDAACCLEGDATTYRSESCCVNSVSVQHDTKSASALTAAPEATAAAGGRASSIVPYASWYGNIASSTVRGAHVTVSPPSPRVAEVGARVSFAVTSTFAPPAGTFSWAVIAGTAGVVASGTATATSTSSSSSASVAVTVTEEMATAAEGAATLLVFTPYDGRGGEAVNVVASQLSFQMTRATNQARALPQSVTISASKDEVRPGASVSVDATASVPGSRVYFLAYDVSVVLQAGGAGASALTAQRALAAVAPKKTETSSSSSSSSSSSYCYPPAEIDGAVVAVITALKTSTCDASSGGGMPEIAFADGGGDMMMADAAAAVPEGAVAKASPTASAAEAGGGSGGGGLASVTRVRSFFPETWVWLDAPSDAVTGVASLSNITAPDTITSWRFAAFATHPTGGLGVADPTAASSLLRVFKPFFVSPNLPYSATRGEDLVLRVGVFNYLETPLAVTVELADAPADYEVVSAGGTTTTVNVGAKGTGSAVFTVRPKRLGDVAVQVSGRTSAEVGYADAVRKTVRVEPEGFPQEEVYNVVVNREEQPSMEETVKLISGMPSSGVVEGSLRSVLSVVGDIMGPSIKGLERLVRVPTGCGEQNMIGMAPNVYVLTYLKAARQLTDELKDRIASNILRGYQRELQYRHPSNGAFSAFGEGSGAGGLGGRGRTSANSGSLWLTAFVVRVFAQSAEVAAGMYVDPNVLSTAAAFIASNQASDGSFTDPSPPLHSEMSGGAGGGAGLTAYCLLAMVWPVSRSWEDKSDSKALRARPSSSDHSVGLSS